MFLKFIPILVLVGLTSCGGSQPDAPPEITLPPVLIKSVVDAGLVYPYGFTIYQDAGGVENIALGNTVGGVISNPTGINDMWVCTNGISNPQTGELYNYRFGKDLEKRYIKSYTGFLERGASYKKSDGSVDLYFVENRDGHIIKIDSNFGYDSVISTFGNRPYDIKVANMAGDTPDIIYSTYGSNQLTLRRGTDDQLMVLADKMSENRAVELFTFAGDSYPSVITTAMGSLKSAEPNTGWVSVVRNHGGYQFTEYRFDARGASYARLVVLDSKRPNDLYLVVSHGLRDEIQDSKDHGLSIYRYFTDTNTVSKVSEFSMPYIYRFDLQDLNGDGVQDIVVGGHDGSGTLTVLLSNAGATPSYDTIPIDQGMVAINDVKFGQTQSGVVTLYLVADNGNGCPRKLGGSRLVRYQFNMPVTAARLRANKL